MALAWFWCGSAIFALVFATICVVADQGWRKGLELFANGLWFLADVIQAIVGILALFG